MPRLRRPLRHYDLNIGLKVGWVYLSNLYQAGLFIFYGEHTPSHGGGFWNTLGKAVANIYGCRCKGFLSTSNRLFASVFMVLPMEGSHPRTTKSPPLEKGGWGDLKAVFQLTRVTDTRHGHGHVIF
jgi:hypothetical protein